MMDYNKIATGILHKYVKTETGETKEVAYKEEDISGNENEKQNDKNSHGCCH